MDVSMEKHARDKRERFLKDLEAVKDKARAALEGARASHDWDHTRRVAALCGRIGPVEGADMEVLLLAAYLHDIGRAAQDGSAGALCHAELGREMAVPILEPLDISQEQKENVLHCIGSHRFRGKELPRTLEARVLFDADKLDSIGAVGVARAFQFAGEVGAVLHNPDVSVEQTRPYTKNDTGFREYTVKLSRIRERMMTDEGRAMAESRHAFMEAFFKRFLDEYEARD